MNIASPIQVLLVEDNPGDADLTRETLENAKLQIDLRVVVDGTQALSYIRQEPPFGDAPRPDLILLDLNLPKLSGLQVLTQIKADAKVRTIPVVVLTSSDAERDIGEAYRLGASCYVTKPVGLEAFQEVVRSIESFWFTIVKLP